MTGEGSTRQLTIRDSEGLLPQYVVRQIYEVTRGEAIIVTGVGQNQMWAAQHYWYDKPNSLHLIGWAGDYGLWPAGSYRGQGRLP